MHSVSVISVRALTAAVEEVGVSRERLLAAAGFTDAQLADAGPRVSAADYGALLRAALTTSGDPALGLRIAGPAAFGRYDMLGSLVEHSRCLREALELAARYTRVFVDGPRLELHEQGDLAQVRLSSLAGDAPELHLLAEFVTSALLYLLRHFVGSAAKARRVLFAYAAPAHRAEYGQVFDGREVFSQPFTGIEFERKWLEYAHSYRSAELHALLKARAEQLLAAVDHDSSASMRVSRWLSSRPLTTPAPRPKMDEAARGIGMSERSLRRHLAREQVRYEELLERDLAARAKQLLADTRHSVQEAGYALGFDSPASFSRAFRRWTGLTPSAFRAARSA